jgi:hypothetical protein
MQPTGDNAQLAMPLHAIERANWARDAASAAPVFIVGDARSGTSLLYRCLQSHSAFLPRDGLKLVESHAMDALQRVEGADSQPPWSLINFMGGEEPYHRFAAEIEPLRRRRRRLRSDFEPRFMRPAKWVAAGEHHVARRYFLGAAESRGAQRLLEKTPQHVQWVQHLKIAFPRARFLFIVRHPVDVFASYRRRYAADPQRWAWAGIDVAAFTERWRTNVRAARNLAGRRWTQLQIVRYDDLTRTPEPTIRQILSFVRVPFEEACLARTTIETPIQTDPLLTGPLVAHEDDWHQHIARDDARRIEEQLSADMSAMGFAPYTDAVQARVDSAR